MISLLHEPARRPRASAFSSMKKFGLWFGAALVRSWSRGTNAETEVEARHFIEEERKVLAPARWLV